MELLFEKQYWGDCTNTFDEDQKHYIYAKYMGLKRMRYSFDLENKRIIDIGGGPTSILLKGMNLKEGLVCDPLEYPEWTKMRYKHKNISVKVIRGEDINELNWDESWIYNCLQHSDDPAKIIKNALNSAKCFRIFEWINVKPHEGHPQMLTKEFLDQCIGKKGNIVQLSESGCFGTAYYNIVNL